MSVSRRWCTCSRAAVFTGVSGVEWVGVLKTPSPGFRNAGLALKRSTVGAAELLREVRNPPVTNAPALMLSALAGRLHAAAPLNRCCCCCCCCLVQGLMGWP
jgi:hypothetical protein